MRVSAVDQIAEGCMTFGWTHDYILAMQAKAFFALLDSSRKRKFKTHNQLMHDLCFVSGVGNSTDQDWVDSTIKRFKLNGWPEENKQKEMAQPIRMSQADQAAVLQSIFDMKAKVEHHGR